MAAIVEALTAVQTALETAGLTVELNRQDEDALGEGECPVAALYWGGATFQQLDSCGNYLWTATIIIDLWAKVETGQPVLNQCDAMASTVAGAFYPDRTFGGKFHDSMIEAVSDLANMPNDQGCITITAQIQFHTAKGDWSTIFS